MRKDIIKDSRSAIEKFLSNFNKDDNTEKVLDYVLREIYELPIPIQSEKKSKRSNPN